MVFGNNMAIIGISTFDVRGLNITAHFGKIVLPAIIGNAIATAMAVYTAINTVLNGKTSHNVKSMIFCGIADTALEHSILHMYIRAIQIT